jgi:hypothetical protein
VRPQTSAKLLEPSSFDSHVQKQALTLVVVISTPKSYFLRFPLTKIPHLRKLFAYVILNEIWVKCFYLFIVAFFFFDFCQPLFYFISSPGTLSFQSKAIYFSST